MSKITRVLHELTFTDILLDADRELDVVTAWSDQSDELFPMTDHIASRLQLFLARKEIETIKYKDQKWVLLKGIIDVQEADTQNIVKAPIYIGLD